MLSRLAAFCVSLATQLQLFLTAFQSDNSLMPFVCGELSSIVPVRIVKHDIRDEATSMTRLLTVKYKKPAHCFIRRHLNVGYLADASTKELLRMKKKSAALLRLLNRLASSTKS